MAKQEQKKHSKSHTGFFLSLSNFKKDLLCIGLLYVITVILFSKVVFNNEVFSDSGDTAAAQAISQGGKLLVEKEHIEPQWFPYIFSGMPSFGSLMYATKDISYITMILHFFAKIIFLNAELSWMIFHFLFGAAGVFLFVRYKGLSQFPSFFAGLTFLMSPFIVGLAQGGHGSQLWALSYIPYTFLAATFLLDKRNMFSIGLLAITLGSLLLTQHEIGRAHV